MILIVQFFEIPSLNSFTYLYIFVDPVGVSYYRNRSLILRALHCNNSTRSDVLNIRRSNSVGIIARITFICYEWWELEREGNRVRGIWTTILRAYLSTVPLPPDSQLHSLCFGRRCGVWCWESASSCLSWRPRATRLKRSYLGYSVRLIFFSILCKAILDLKRSVYFLLKKNFFNLLCNVYSAYNKPNNI